MISGDVAAIIVIIVRGLVPFLILRWPLAGILLAIVGDISDIMIFEAFGRGFLEVFPYHNIDKVFDIWYLSFAFLVVRRWTDPLARKTATFLFGWRFVGFLVFMIWNYRAAFFFAPNIFEFFFLAVLIIKKFNKKFKFTWKSITMVLLIVGIPNIIKEYIMHYKYPDMTWDFFRDKFFWWMYD